MSQTTGTLYRVPTWDSLRLVLERARREAGDPGHVVLTGDLSHEHTVAGHRLLRGQLTAGAQPRCAPRSKA